VLTPEEGWMPTPENQENLLRRLRERCPHVRLFVQNEGPPKCLYRYDGPPPPDPTFMSPNQLKWFRHAAKWWLISCISAEHGRLTIERYDWRTDLHFPQGRVLASGGKP